MVTQPTSDAYFREVWADDDDPWDHGSRWYETRKYGLTISALPAERYRRGFEPGCGAGFLTVRLAERCDALVAMERSARGADVTRRRCGEHPGVEVLDGRIPEEWPDGTFDLVVLSELLYYLDDAQLAAAIHQTGDCLQPGGHVLAVHYRRRVPEHARLGDDVHAALRAAFGTPLANYTEDDFVLDVFAPA